MPLVGIKNSVVFELKWILYFTEEKKAIISETQVGAKPILSIIFYKKHHFALSYALCISNFTAHRHFLPFFFFIAWILSYASKILSVISLLITKALCCSQIMSGRINFNLFTNILEITL
jgi:hypothetical protein